MSRLYSSRLLNVIAVVACLESIWNLIAQPVYALKSQRRNFKMCPAMINRKCGNSCVNIIKSSGLGTAGGSTRRIRVVVHSYWGRDSPFNLQLVLDASINDTFSDIKQQITQQTDIPKELQSLLVLDGPVNDQIPQQAVQFEEHKSLADCRHKLQLCPKTGELELHLLLNMPAPYCGTKHVIDSTRIGEYLVALQRTMAMTQNYLADPTNVKVDPFKRNIKSYRSRVKRTYRTLGLEPPKASKETVKESMHFCKPNRRIYLMVNHDYPVVQDPDCRLLQSIKTHFPINWELQLKYSLACYVILATTKQPPWVREVLKWSPLVTLALGTRAGNRIFKSILYSLPTHAIPKGITNLLSAPIAQLLATP